MDRKQKAVKISTPHNAADHVHHEVDRISALPDEILLYILSLLGTRKAAETSVLSTRWRFLFASVPDIDLRLSSDPRGQSLFAFLSSAYRIFILRNWAQIRKFKLDVRLVNEWYHMGIDTLISGALLCKVQELEILCKLDILCSSSHSSYTVNQASLAKILMCRTLISLKVDWRPKGDLIVPPDSVWLPNLKSLRFGRLRLVDEDSIQRLIQGCPELQELDLCIAGFDHDRIGHETRVAKISSSSLTKLKLECRPTNDYNIFVESETLETFEYVDLFFSMRKIRFHTPNLKHLAYTIGWLGGNFDQLPNCLVGANIKIYYLRKKQDQDVYEHLNRVACVKSLTLEQKILKVLHNRGRPFPSFKNLTRLELDSLSCWKMLPSLFGCCPSLQELVLGKVSWRGSLQGFVRLLPEVIPICFIEHLQEIEIQTLNFRSSEFEFKLIEYFLHNGKTLKKMTLGMTSLVPEGILSLKRCSKHCHVVGRGIMFNY